MPSRVECSRTRTKGFDNVEEEGADSYCRAGNTALLAGFVLDWLDEPSR